MQITPQKIAAIKALADDPRGEPNTRATAQRKLEQIRISHPCLFVTAPRAPQNPPNPRRAKTPEYEKYRFMNIDQWKRTSKGNYVLVIGEHRITLFKSKSAWAHARASVSGFQEPMFSAMRYATLREAQEAAWTSLATLS
jgi:hypothetical protein